MKKILSVLLVILMISSVSAMCIQAAGVTVENAYIDESGWVEIEQDTFFHVKGWFVTSEEVYPSRIGYWYTEADMTGTWCADELQFDDSDNAVSESATNSFTVSRDSELEEAISADCAFRFEMYLSAVQEERAFWITLMFGDYTPVICKNINGYITVEAPLRGPIDPSLYGPGEIYNVWAPDTNGFMETTEICKIGSWIAAGKTPIDAVGYSINGGDIVKESDSTVSRDYELDGIFAANPGFANGHNGAKGYRFMLNVDFSEMEYDTYTVALYLHFVDSDEDWQTYEERTFTVNYNGKLWHPVPEIGNGMANTAEVKDAGLSADETEYIIEGWFITNVPVAKFGYTLNSKKTEKIVFVDDDIVESVAQRPSNNDCNLDANLKQAVIDGGMNVTGIDISRLSAYRYRLAVDGTVLEKGDYRVRIYVQFDNEEQTVLEINKPDNTYTFTKTLDPIPDDPYVPFDPGDVDGSGEINNKDVVRLFRYLSGDSIEVVEEALDVNEDGAVNNKDIIALFKIVSEK